MAHGSITAPDLAAALGDELRRRIGDSRYELWFSTKAIFFFEADRLRVGVPNHFYAEWLQKTFAGELMQALEVMLGKALPVVFKVDPGLFQAARIQAEALQVKTPVEAVKLPAELLESNPSGHGLEIVQLRPGWQAVRFLSELEVLYNHFQHGGYRLCLGTQCDRCKQDVEVYLCGYADAIRATGKVLEGQIQFERVILGMPATATQPLLHRSQAGKKLRGSKVELFRGQARSSKCLVKILEDTWARTMPEPTDLRKPLMRRHRLKTWPEYAALFEGEP